MYNYKNGNVAVTIYPNGTKIREWDDNEKQNCVFPESCDVKITNYCDANCPYCHEVSNTQGRHGDINLFKDLWKDMPAGTEVAVGGGNPLSHPQFIELTEFCKEKKIFFNTTVNQIHIKDNIELLNNLIDNRNIWGLGISVRDFNSISVVNEIKNKSNIVYHVIMGVHTIDEIIKFGKEFPNSKILVLGYKTFGMGKKYYNENVKKELENWNKNITSLLNSTLFSVISFDNLAIEQLELSSKIEKSVWDSRYMGEDGTHTMYFDLVKAEFAMSSTSKERHKINNKSLTECFLTIKK